MSAARTKATQRLAAIRGALEDFGLHDKPLLPQNESHNASVRIVRNGLAVQCFNVLEDFVRARSGEVLAGLSASSVVFHNLPLRLQQAATVDAIRAINYQIRIRDKADRIHFVQQYSARVASTATATVDLPDVSLFHSSSNIDVEQFYDALRAFAVRDPWSQMSGLCSRLGLSGVPAKNVLTSFAQRRHRAAHDASAAVSESDLIQSIADASSLAVGFDVLVSKAMSALSRLSAPPPDTYRSVSDQNAIPVRTIRVFGSGFAEKRLGNLRNTRLGKDGASLWPAAVARAAAEEGALVLFGPTGSVAGWYV